MTTRRFDAPASITPRRSARDLSARAKRIARRVGLFLWLAVILYCGDKKRLATFPQRHGIPGPVFSRDVRRLRRFGLELQAALYGRLEPLLYFEAQEEARRHE
jgi:hypothetical protein